MAACATPIARRRLDARRLERLHQLLEANALDAAEQVVGADQEVVKGELKLLHAAIAEHLDLGAGETLDRPGIVLAAARLSASSIDSPRCPASFGSVRTSSVIRSARTGCIRRFILPSSSLTLRLAAASPTAGCV
jgi:hypothetical protein